MSTKITYKGNEIANITETATKTLKTQGKYCEGDIIVQNTQDGGSEPTLITKSITENGTYNATDDNADGYSSVEVNVAGSGAGFGCYEFIQKYTFSPTSTIVPSTSFSIDVNFDTSTYMTSDYMLVLNCDEKPQNPPANEWSFMLFIRKKNASIQTSILRSDGTIGTDNQSTLDLNFTTQKVTIKALYGSFYPEYSYTLNIYGVRA